MYMPSFVDYPKQWIISQEAFVRPEGARSGSFLGWHILVADKVPMLRILSSSGADIGRIIGWAIDGDKIYSADTDVPLAPDQSVAQFIATLGGRFVCLSKDQTGKVVFQEDSAGNLPAVFYAKKRLVASTISIIEQFEPLERAADIEAIFNFPEKRGFLPFGLTPRKGVRRLMPNHILDLSDFSVKRAWPSANFLSRPPMSQEQARLLTQEIAQIMARRMKAILQQGETVLYLSGGHDSRMVLAACQGQSENLRCETLGGASSLEVHVARQAASVLQVPHHAMELVPASRSDVSAWLRRTGYTMYDPVSELVATAVAYETPGAHPISGTGAELARATNWGPDDIDAPSLDCTTLLKRIRVPDIPIIRTEAQIWLDGLATADAAMVLDMAKIEQIHGCWAGAAIYGHPLQLPSLYPFSGQRWSEIALSLPKEYRANGTFYKDYINALCPDLLGVAVNRARGLDRLRFLPNELKRLVPARVKRALKPLR